MSNINAKPVKITETILRDAHQSLIATRMKTEEMLPIIEKMDTVGYNSVECWGGATFDASLRFLKEDPWERLRKLKDGFKNTKLQMLLRGQNLLGYRHYADDVVEYFVQKSIANGIDIIRIFRYRVFGLTNGDVECRFKRPVPRQSEACERNIREGCFLHIFGYERRFFKRLYYSCAEAAGGCHLSFKHRIDVSFDSGSDDRIIIHRVAAEGVNIAVKRALCSVLIADILAE